MSELKLHHSALSRGYIRVGQRKDVPYKGRFGVGRKVFKHNPFSSRYCIVEYWVVDSESPIYGKKVAL